MNVPDKERAVLYLSRMEVRNIVHHGARGLISGVSPSPHPETTTLKLSEADWGEFGEIWEAFDESGNNLEGAFRCIYQVGTKFVVAEPWCVIHPADRKSLKENYPGVKSLYVFEEDVRGYYIRYKYDLDASESSRQLGPYIFSWDPVLARISGKVVSSVALQIKDLTDDDFIKCIGPIHREDNEGNVSIDLGTGVIYNDWDSAKKAYLDLILNSSVDTIWNRNMWIWLSLFDTEGKCKPADTTPQLALPFPE